MGQESDSWDKEGDVMFPERKKIAVRDVNVGAMVIGQHVDMGGGLYTIVAGEIKRKIEEEKNIVYFIKGKTMISPNKDIDTINFSGFLKEDEIEVIDKQKYNTISELYDFAWDQMTSGLPHRDIDEKINEMRHKSRAELEEKYAVQEQEVVKA